MRPPESMIPGPWPLAFALSFALPFALGGCVPGGGSGGGGGDGAVGSDADVSDACTPSCAERACGDDGCGGTCGMCGDAQTCTAGGQCIEVPASCGDAVCDADGESCENCPADCGACCGDGLCAPQHGEHCGTCPADCGCAEGEACDVEAGVCASACTPACDGRSCGDDGCGGVCGACGAAQVCGADGLCVERPADCGDGTCGEDEDCALCPEDCGCGADEACEAGACVPAVQCDDPCDAQGTATCTDDGFAYRLCAPDPAQPGCQTFSRRVPCSDGRTCAGEAATCEGACRTPQVLLLVDRSSSMAGERWAFTHPALTDAAGRRPRTARLGVRPFPAGDDGCAAGAIVPPAFESEPVLAAVEPPTDVAQTPIAAAFEGLDAAFGDPEDGQSVVLITDGDETCQGEQAAVEHVAALRRRGVRTFVIGIGQQANHELLGAIAGAGGTARGAGPGHYAVADAAGLRAALDEIFQRLDTCACAVGDQRCQGDALQTCRDVDGVHTFDGSDAACPFGCDDAVSACYPVCDGSDPRIRCEGDVATRCDARGEGYDEVERCVDGCRDGVGCNAACRPGERRCAGDVSEVCNGAGDAFEAAENCADGCRAADGLCHPVCRPGELRCNGDTQEQCNAAGDGYMQAERCAFGCNAGRAACNPVCRPGEARCDGDDWTRCRAAGDGYDVAERCAIACVPGAGCQGCAPYVDARCGDDGLERCTPAGDAFEADRACICNPATATCLPPLYTPNPEGSARFDNRDVAASGGRLFMWDQRQSWSWLPFNALNNRSAEVACRQLGWPDLISLEREGAGNTTAWRTLFSCLGDEMALMQCRTPNDVLPTDVARITCAVPDADDAYCIDANLSWWYQADGVVRRQTCLAGCDARTGRCRADAGDPARCLGGWTVTELGGAGAGPWVAEGDLTVDPERHAQFATCALRATGSNDIYRFTAPVAGTYRFSTTGANGGDTIVFARRWCTAEGSEAACNDDAPNTRFSRIEAELAAGEQLYVFVDAYEVDGRSRYELTAERIVP